MCVVKNELLTSSLLLFLGRLGHFYSIWCPFICFFLKSRPYLSWLRCSSNLLLRADWSISAALVSASAWVMLLFLVGRNWNPMCCVAMLWTSMVRPLQSQLVFLADALELSYQEVHLVSVLLSKHVAVLLFCNFAFHLFGRMSRFPVYFVD